MRRRAKLGGRMRRSAPAPPLRARHVQLSTACARERALYLFTVLSGLISGWFRYVHSIKSLEQWCVLSRCARTRIAVGRRARVSDPRPGRPTTACNTSYTLYYDDREVQDTSFYPWTACRKGKRGSSAQRLAGALEEQCTARPHQRPTPPWSESDHSPDSTVDRKCGETLKSCRKH